MNKTPSLDEVMDPGFWPKLKFKGAFDDFEAREAKARGYSGPVVVELEDGKQYPVEFSTADKELTWIGRHAKEDGKPFSARAGMILLQEITLRNMFLAARELAKGGEFSFFSYLKEWDPEKEQRSYDKHSMGDSVSQYQYPTVVQEFE